MSRLSRLPLLFVPYLFGCQIFGDQLEDLENTVDGLTNTFIVEGIYLGVAQPENENIDLSNTEYADGARATVFLAEASSLDAIEDTPISDALVEFDTTGGVFAMRDEGSGRYESSGDDGLDYVKDDVVSIFTNHGGSDHSVTLTTPAAPDPGLDTAIAPGSAMTVDLSGQGFDSALVVVLDPTGSVTFSNAPEGLKELYEFTHGGGQVNLEVPGDAFADPGLYVVGVAGLVNAATEDLVEVNTALSTFTAGKMKFSAVCATDNQTVGDLCE